MNYKIKTSIKILSIISIILLILYLIALYKDGIHKKILIGYYPITEGSVFSFFIFVPFMLFFFIFSIFKKNLRVFFVNLIFIILISFFFSSTIIPFAVSNAQNKKDTIIQNAIKEVNPVICDSINIPFAMNIDKENIVNSCQSQIIRNLILESKEYKDLISRDVLSQDSKVWFDTGHRLCDRQNNLTLNQKNSCASSFLGIMENKANELSKEKKH